MTDTILRVIEGRKSVAIDCKNTNIVTTTSRLVYNEKTHFTLAPYWPRHPSVKACALPRTFASGPILGTLYWTDGALILRDSPNPEADTVEFKVPETEFNRYIRYARPAKFICSAYHDAFRTCRIMCVVHTKGVSFFHLHYADHAFIASLKLQKKTWSRICIGMNRDNSACIFSVGGFIAAAISPCHFPSQIEPQLRVQVENYYEDYRNRPEPV